MKRINIKDILRNPTLRRELMINVIIATQARERIVTTKKQAARAYDKIKKGETIMSHDPTEEIRRQQQAEINARAAEREPLEKEHGQVWNTEELRRDFSVVGFMAPYVVVIRNSDGVKGSLQFQHHPRYYFNFIID